MKPEDEDEGETQKNKNNQHISFYVSLASQGFCICQIQKI